jgi:arginase
MSGPPASSAHRHTTNAPDSGRVDVTHFAGRAGDHNNLAMVGSRELADALATRFGAEPSSIGAPEPALSVGWAEELAAAMPTLQAMAERLDQVFAAGNTPVTASSRCAVALATLPVVASHRPDAVVVWFDAHADLNTPENTTTGYLGGLAFSGPLGLWDSGLGGGLAFDNAILVGARDIDPPEQQLIDTGTITLVKVGPSMADDLRSSVAGRPVYVHIDCDVLDAGTVPTDYRVPDGMTLDDLRATASALAESEIVGIEIGELESTADGDTPPSYVTQLLVALEPLLGAAQRTRARLELLTLGHARPLERFERSNRAFFAAQVGDRGDDYFAHFDDQLAARVHENREGRSLFFVIVDTDGEVLGRVNISDIDQPALTELGFRVAAHAQGRGIATRGVVAALDIAATRGVTTVNARVSTANLASRRVLEHCGFDRTGQAATPSGSSGFFIGYRKHLVVASCSPSTDPLLTAAAATWSSSDNVNAAPRTTRS